MNIIQLEIKCNSKNSSMKLQMWIIKVVRWPYATKNKSDQHLVKKTKTGKTKSNKKLIISLFLGWIIRNAD